MRANDGVKENIIRAATELIEQGNGDMSGVTARRIAEKAGIGLGLINYHFGSKDGLITVCVQRIIGGVIDGFHMDKEYGSDKERLTAWAVYVFDFLFDHAAIARISILGDFQNYRVDCNSVFTQKGFMKAITDRYAGKDVKLLCFVLTSAMQAAFLSGESSGELLGYDFAKTDERAVFIGKLVEAIL